VKFEAKLICFPVVLIWYIRYTKTALLKKVLIVEDDIDTIEIVEAILNRAGYAVIKINREITIREIAGIKPNLVILDYLLPYALGNELCLEIKANPKTESIPVILYSASNLAEGISRKCKADGFISKPFDLDHLVSLVDRLAN
jgi:DNA-binding response OmpR family regulator